MPDYYTFRAAGYGHGGYDGHRTGSGGYARRGGYDGVPNVDQRTMARPPANVDPDFVPRASAPLSAPISI
jgi:hypothetical protein